MRALVGCVILFGSLSVTACQSLDTVAASYDPAPRATWESQPEINKPFYAYKTEDGRSSVRISGANIALSPSQPGNVVLVPVGTTQVTRRDGTNQTVTIYTGVSSGQTIPR